VVNRLQLLTKLLKQLGIARLVRSRENFTLDKISERVRRCNSRGKPRRRQAYDFDL